MSKYRTYKGQLGSDSDAYIGPDGARDCDESSLTLWEIEKGTKGEFCAS
jgi:hypothetical protein